MASLGVGQSRTQRVNNTTRNGVKSSMAAENVILKRPNLRRLGSGHLGGHDGQRTLGWTRWAADTWVDTMDSGHLSGHDGQRTLGWTRWTADT